MTPAQLDALHTTQRKAAARASAKVVLSPTTSTSSAFSPLVASPVPSQVSITPQIPAAAASAAVLSPTTPTAAKAEFGLSIVIPNTPALSTITAAATPFTPVASDSTALATTFATSSAPMFFQPMPVHHPPLHIFAHAVARRASTLVLAQTGVFFSQLMAMVRPPTPPPPPPPEPKAKKGKDKGKEDLEEKAEPPPPPPLPRSPPAPLSPLAIALHHHPKMHSLVIHDSLHSPNGAAFLQHNHGHGPSHSHSASSPNLHPHLHAPLSMAQQFSSISFFESVYLVMHWSDSNGQWRTGVVQTLLVVNSVVTSLVPHTRILTQFMPSIILEEPQVRCVSF
jgi:hypothetical protein